MHKIAKADLERSGITTEEAGEAEIVSTKDASEYCEDFRTVPGLIIPYIDPWTDAYMQYENGDGKMHDFCRVRYLDPPPNAHGFKKKKHIRYGQPKDSGVHPYFPVTDMVDWVSVLEDPTTPIMITEGEKKALVGCLEGIPTVGLGGVYNFNNDGELLDQLAKAEWEGRPVYICYDSDAANNPKIKVAEGRLATELSMVRGASVFLVRLPDSKSGAKVGLDDFVVDTGSDALHKLLDQAPQMRKVDKEVIAMNSEVAWIENEGLVLNLRTDTWLKKADFTKGSEFSTRKIDSVDAKMKPIQISVANAWLTHPHARRYANTVFRPGTADKAIPMPGGGVAYNRFRGLSGLSGDVAPFFDLYDHLMSRTDEFDHDLIWKTICWKIQNLGEMVNLGLMLLGAQGGGKSLFCDILAKMVDPYSQVISSNMLGSDYNGWIETSVIVVMNEAKESSLKWNMETLRTYITDDTQPCNEKYRPSRQVRNNGFYIFNSNQKKAGAFPDKDRRMIIIGCPDKHPQGKEFYAPIWKWFKSDGPKKLLHWMQNYDLKGWRPPHEAPETREKRMAYYASLTPIQKVGDAMRHADKNVVELWMAAALNWATSEAVGAAPSQIALADQIAQSMMHIQVRPFYTPEELSLLFPAISGTLSMGRVKDATPAGALAQELMQCGIDYLRCADNFDGFMHKGLCKQYLVVANHDKFTMPITQRKFDNLMANYPTYGEVRRKNKAKKRKSKRNKST